MPLLRRGQVFLVQNAFRIGRSLLLIQNNKHIGYNSFSTLGRTTDEPNSVSIDLNKIPDAPQSRTSFVVPLLSKNFQLKETSFVTLYEDAMQQQQIDTILNKASIKVSFSLPSNIHQELTNKLQQVITSGEVIENISKHFPEISVYQINNDKENPQKMVYTRSLYTEMSKIPLEQWKDNNFTGIFSL